MSSAIGFRKEMDYASQDRGFSFKGLVADMAGTHFAELAMASSASANTLQQRLAWGQGDARLIDNIVRLEKVLGKAVFERRLAGPGDERFE